MRAHIFLFYVLIGFIIRLRSYDDKVHYKIITPL